MQTARNWVMRLKMIGQRAGVDLCYNRRSVHTSSGTLARIPPFLTFRNFKFLNSQSFGYPRKQFSNPGIHSVDMAFVESGEEPLRILLVGSGGREHTLVWKLAQAPTVEAIFVAPGTPPPPRGSPINSIQEMAAH